jgi:hypothetical protein
MDHMVMCTKDEARACWTLPQILKVSDDPEFKAHAEDNYLLADEEDSNDGDDGDDDISGGDLLEAIGFCPPVKTQLCDWAHYGLCPTGLEPEPCQKEGANCDRSAHRLCVSGWEARYDMGRQQGIASLCMTHHPTAGL